MNNFCGVVFGWVLGVICLGGAIVLDNSSAAHNTEAKEYLLQLKDRLDKCEASLPRNETCVLVARKKEV